MNYPSQIEYLFNFVIFTILGGRDRRGGPILTFPNPSKIDKLSSDEIKAVVCYLLALPSADVKEKGFAVIVDIRNGSWSQGKLILNVLQVPLKSFSCVCKHT